jgi:hypothetical protein
VTRFLKDFEKLISRINNDELEREVEKISIKDIEKKQSEYLDRK